MQAHPLWKAARADLIIEPLSDSEFAIFNPAFADSTVINTVDFCLLRLLLDHPNGWNEADLVKATAGELELPPDGRLRDYVAESLRQMETMGLLICHGVKA